MQLGLTQEELANLLGCDTGENICRFERHTRVPKLEVALAYQIIFNVSVHELFPDIYENVEQLIRQRAGRLLEIIKNNQELTVPECKIKTLNSIVSKKSTGSKNDT